MFNTNFWTNDGFCGYLERKEKLIKMFNGRQQILISCFFAQRVLYLFEDVILNNLNPRVAIELAKQSADGATNDVSAAAYRVSATASLASSCGLIAAYNAANAAYGAICVARNIAASNSESALFYMANALYDAAYANTSAKNTNSYKEQNEQLSLFLPIKDWQLSFHTHQQLWN